MSRFLFTSCSPTATPSIYLFIARHDNGAPTDGWADNARNENRRVLFKGVRRRGLTGLKPPPEIPRKNYLLIQIRSIFSSLLTTLRRLTCQILGYFSVNVHIKLLLPAAFLSPKCTKYRLAAGLRPDPLESLQRSPRPPSCIKGAYF